jgi:hypothetical protein
MFSINLATDAETNLTTFTTASQSVYALSSREADLYEVRFGREYGAHPNQGELVQYNISSGHSTVLHKFSGGADGAHPYWPLVYYEGAYYGTTTGGGNPGCFAHGGCGVIFKYVP